MTKHGYDEDFDMECEGCGRETACTIIDGKWLCMECEEIKGGDGNDTI